MAWVDMTDLTGLVAWYKPETLAATYANGDPISTWADSSGNSRDLTGTTTTRPLAAASAINGYMAADFDGTDDILSSASYTHSGNTVAVAVMNLDIVKNYSSAFCIDGVSPPSYINDFYLMQFDAIGRLRVMSSLPSNNHVISNESYLFGAIAASTDYIFSGACSAVGGLCKANGQDALAVTHTGSPSSASGTAYIHMGDSGLASGFFDGKICEVIIWSPTTNYAEVPWVEGYLADKYAITLADGHLFKNEPPQSAPTTYNAAGGGSSKLINGGLVD